MTRGAWAGAVLLLAACGREANVDVNVRVDTTDAPATPVSPSSPATPDLAAADPASASWTPSPQGAGPVRVGMPAAEVERLLAPIVPGQAMEGSTCRYLNPARTPRGVSFMVNEGTVARVDVGPLDLGDEVPVAELPRTAAGVGIGSTQAEVQAAYGARMRTEPHHYTDGRYLVVTPEADTSRQIIFETDETGRVTYLRAGRLPEVAWVEGCS
jgi:hypothetical protein